MPKSRLVFFAAIFFCGTIHAIDPVDKAGSPKTINVPTVPGGSATTSGGAAVKGGSGARQPSGTRNDLPSILPKAAPSKFAPGFRPSFLPPDPDFDTSKGQFPPPPSTSLLPPDLPEFDSPSKAKAATPGTGTGSPVGSGTGAGRPGGAGTGSGIAGGGAADRDRDRRATGGELVIDLRKGVPVGAQPELTRLKAVVYAINSINTKGRELLRVNDLLQAAFKGGQIPEQGEAKVRIDLTKFLNKDQLQLLNNLLIDDPFSCNRAGDLDSGVRADSVVNAIFNSTNYYRFLDINDSRRDFENDVGIAPEFGVAADRRDTSPDTQRLILAPGDSGVVHKEAYRRIVLQKQGRGPGRGGLVIRTEDSEKHNATRLDHNFSLRPTSAKGDAAEEIWELPNGFRAYALRNAAGTLQTAAPPTLVTANIVNPVTCMRCHDTGYIATTGESRSVDIDSLKKVNINLNEPGVSRDLIKALHRSTAKEYASTIEGANERMEAAIKSSGSLRPREFSKYFAQLQDGEIRLDQLAKELDANIDDVAAAVAGDRAFGDVLNLNNFREAVASYRETRNPENLPSISRTDLERDVRTGRDSNESLYCAIQQRVQGFESARLRRRGGGGTDVALDPAISPTPVGRPKTVTH